MNLTFSRIMNNHVIFKYLKDFYYKHLDRFVHTIKECGSLEKRREIILENS